jgi:hypothetical protein
MVKLLEELRNNPHDERLQEELADLLFNQTDILVPAIQREQPELAPPMMQSPNAVTVVEARVITVSGDIELGSLTAQKAMAMIPSTVAGAIPPVCEPGPPIAEKPKVGRVPWMNYVATQISQPLKIAKPATLDELKAVLKEAATIGCPVRAVGSGHSWSDSALTDGIVIETHALNNPIAIDAAILKDGVDANSLLQTEAGIVIRDLISLLESQGRALINMGGYDGQTLAGVISTSTHGSGLTLGSFSSAVEALIIVTADGDVLQIEKANGVSDPAKFAAAFGTSRTLKQDDDLFNACVVGVGSLGVIYAAIIRVMPFYYLQEVRVIKPWTEVKTLLQGGLLDEYRHVEVLFNPHKVKGRNSCLLTTRKIVPKPAGPLPERPFRNVFAEYLASLPGADRVLAYLFNEYSTASPQLVEQALTALEDPQPYTNVYYKILNVGAVNAYAAVCAEYAIDLDKSIAAMDAIFATAGKYESSGVYHSSPSAMRWVAASPGYLSMQPVPTCMIEMPNLQAVFGYPDIYWRYEKMLTRDFSARPHWGQVNFLTGSREMIRKLYPKLDAWLAVFDSFNQSQRFHSVFTDRVGFSSHAP